MQLFRKYSSHLFDGSLMQICLRKWNIFKFSIRSCTCCTSPPTRYHILQREVGLKQSYPIRFDDILRYSPIEDNAPGFRPGCSIRENEIVFQRFWSAFRSAYLMSSKLDTPLVYFVPWYMNSLQVLK